MKKNVKIIINYGTLKKWKLGIYLLVLWIVLTYITLPDLEMSIKNVWTSSLILCLLCILFFVRIIVDYSRTKKLTPNPNSTTQLRKAKDYLQVLEERISKVYKNCKNDYSYQEFKEACTALDENFDGLLK